MFEQHWNANDFCRDTRHGRWQSRCQTLMASTMAGQSNNCQSFFVKLRIACLPSAAIPMDRRLLETRSAYFWKTFKARAQALTHRSVHTR